MTSPALAPAETEQPPERFPRQDIVRLADNSDVPASDRRAGQQKFSLVYGDE